MNTRIEEILTMWHKRFEEDGYEYSEYEPSDIEYFVGCMLYNQFAFSKAHHNLKTIDLSYDFLSTCGDDEYKKAKEIIQALVFENELEKLQFLQNYIEKVQKKYAKDELYLMDRLAYHVHSMAERYEKNVEVKCIKFENPLLRK